MNKGYSDNLHYQALDLSKALPLTATMEKTPQQYAMAVLSALPSERQAMVDRVPAVLVPEVNACLQRLCAERHRSRLSYFDGRV